MRLAVIDCGTNTFNLLITRVVDKNQHQKIFNTRIPVRLGESSSNGGQIAEAAFKRGLVALAAFKEFIVSHNVDKVIAFATAAIREADNGEDFVREAKTRYDIDIQVINGDREAELIYFGIKGAVALTDKVSLIMDIGGGSNEFILANKNRIFWKRSFMIGAARLLEKFSHSSPITKEEMEQINYYLTEQLRPLFLATKDHPPVELVGSSGAFESIVEMINGELGGEPLTSDKTEYHVDLNKNFSIADRVFRSTVEERRNIKGLVEMRVDMIVISCLMVNHILNNLNLQKLRVSTFSLKEGALLDYMHNLK